MKHINGYVWALSAAVLCLPLAAQDRVLGVQGRLSLPMDNLSDLNGGKPGVGIQLQAERPLGDEWSYRLLLGADQFLEGQSKAVSTEKGKAMLMHAGFEGVYWLEPDLGPARLGPYLLAGFSFVSWDISRRDSDLGSSSSRRVVHLAGQMGFGYRLRPGLDFEVKGMYGRVDSDMAAGLFTAGLTLRF